MAEIICLIGNQGRERENYALAHAVLWARAARPARSLHHDGQWAPPLAFRNIAVRIRRRPHRASARQDHHGLARTRGLDWRHRRRANRIDTDSELYAESDLVLLPFRDSQEDLRVVCDDLKRLPHAYALPSQWPSNPWQYKASLRLLESIPHEFQSRILAPVFRFHHPSCCCRATCPMSCQPPSTTLAERSGATF